MRSLFLNTLGMSVLAYAAFTFGGCQLNTDDTTAVSPAMSDTPTMATELIPSLPATPYSYANIQLPAYLTTGAVQGQINTPANNQITDNGATLGRVLFYDKKLSLNNTVSCASCHKQEHGFSDPAKFSVGFKGGLTDRNSMSLLNARYYPNGRFFWDERAANAEAQATMPIVHPVEMGMTMNALVTKLSALSYYPPLFQKAFGTTTVDSSRVARSLAQFVRSIVSYRSKYDEGRSQFAVNTNPANVNFANFTQQENLGKNLFFTRGNCGACHGTETFSSPPNAQNNGLDMMYTDNGVGAVTGIQNQNGQFKAPSLKSIEKTAPFMHDGRFATLEQVVEHYNSGVKNHPNLSPPLRNPPGTPGAGQPRRLNLTQQEKDALVAFLKTLTDTGVATDVKFSNPFVVAVEKKPHNGLVAKSNAPPAMH
ncbi:MAG: c-type cytochrome [Candidatus Kapabacteria bacterium]|nr:c-type cytochrome [Candidatus Kapabacteria bacterium]